MNAPDPGANAPTRERHTGDAHAARIRAAMERLRLGDRVRVVVNGLDQEAIVTSEPAYGSDGTVTFTVADPEAVARTERLRPWLGLPPEQRAAKTRTDDEDAALSQRFATGGIVHGPGVGGDGPPPWLSGCAYGSGGPR